MTRFSAKEIEHAFYCFGLFASRHPVSMILFSAIMVFSCCYPLLNLPLPGREPVLFSLPRDDNVVEKSSAYKSTVNPSWFSSDGQVAYIQQFLFRTSIPCKAGKVNDDVFKDFISLSFDAIKILSSKPNMTRCFDITAKKKLKHGQSKLFPELGCLVTSPALFWNNNKNVFLKDNNIVETIRQYDENVSEELKSIRDIYFGIPEKLIGLSQCVQHKDVYYSFAVTLVLEKYNSKYISDVHQHLLQVFSKSSMAEKLDCDNATQYKETLCKHSPGITHVYYKPQIRFKDLIPLVSTYFILGCYIYFSVRKINFVKSKIGMAFSAVVSVMASLMMAVGLCSLTGLAPIQNGGEIFPYLVCIIGLENILVITKSVVATPIHMEVEKRIALGLKREGCSITKNIVMEFVLIGLGYFTFIPEIQEFCAFAVVGVLSDFLMHMMFFVTVLSIDIRRLDVAEDMYSYPVSTPDGELFGDDFSALQQVKKSRKMSTTDEAHSLETGGKQITILKIPKRLRVVFFFADTRMIQRGLMVLMVIWVACLVYSDPMGYGTFSLDSTKRKVDFYATKNLQKTSISQESENQLFYTESIKWTTEDLFSFQNLRFRHWPTLFAYYNVTLADRFVSILPVLFLPIDLKHNRNSTNNFPQYMSDLKHTNGNESSFAVVSHHVNTKSKQLSYTGEYQMTGLDYYLTLLLGAISGMLMVFVLNIMYRCVCSRNYANWRLHRPEKSSLEPGSHISSVGESLPLSLSDHNQIIEFVHANENIVASTDISGVLKTWDFQTGELISTFDRKNNSMDEYEKDILHDKMKDHHSTFGSCIWSLTSYKQLLIVGCDNGCIEVWDYSLSQFRCGHDSGKSGVIGIAVEFPRLVAARINGSLDFYHIEGSNLSSPTVQYRGSSRNQTNLDKDIVSLQLIYTIKSAHQQPISAFKVAMGRILTGSCDHTLKLFTIQDARCQYTMFGHTGPVSCIFMDKGTPAGAVSGSADGTVRLWDLLTGCCLHKLEEHKEPISAVECTSLHIVSTAQDAKMCIWSRRSGFLLQIIKLDSSISATMTMLGKKMCVTGGQGDILLWDIRKGELLQRIDLHSGSLHRPTVSYVQSITHLSVVCALGRELRVVNFPSVMEKCE